MAAIIETSPRPTSALPYRRPAAQRPDLRLIQGGRRPASPSELLRRRLVAGLVAVLVGARRRRGGRRRRPRRARRRRARPARERNARPRGHRPHVVVVGAPGDTYWSIARRLQPTGDVRPLVDRLAAADTATTSFVPASAWPSTDRGPPTARAALIAWCLIASCLITWCLIAW